MTGYLRLELLRTARSGSFVGYTIGFPVVFYLLFTTVITSRPVGSVDFKAYYMVSMALYGAIGTALTGVGARIAIERTRGWTRHLAVSPLRPGAYVIVKAVGAAVLTLPVIALIMLIGAVVNGVTLPWHTWLGLLPAIWLGALPFAALGVAIGYTFRDEMAQMAALTVYFVLSIAGGLWVPTAAFPGWLRAIAQGMPTYRAGELSWRLLGGQQPLTLGALVLLIWAAVFAALAVWRYRKA